MKVFIVTKRKQIKHDTGRYEHGDVEIDKVFDYEMNAWDRKTELEEFKETKRDNFGFEEVTTIVAEIIEKEVE